MNKTKIGMICLLGLIVFLLSAVFAQGAVEITSGLTGDKVVLSVDYGDLREDDEGNDSMALSDVSLTLQNDQPLQETVTLAIANPGTGYNFGLSHGTQTGQSITVDVPGNNGTATVTLTSVVPLSVDSGVHTAATLTLNTDNYAIETDVLPMMEITKITAYVDGEKKDSVSSDGDKIKNIKPGDEVELKFEIDNNFDKHYGDGDLSGIELEFDFADEDDEDDFGDSIDDSLDFDIDAGDEADTDDTTISFTVPREAEDKTYELEIHMEVEDDNDATHTVDWTLDLEVDREKDDVQLEKAYFTSDVLKCGQRDTTLKIKMTNFGSNDQDAAALSIFSDALGLTYNFDNIEMDSDPEKSDNSYSKTVPITISDDVVAGEYYVDVYAYIEDDEEVDHEFIKLVLEECPVVEPEETEDNDTVLVNNLPTDGENLNTDSGIIETTEGEFGSFQSTGVLVLLIAAGVLLLVMIILVVVLLVRKKN